LQSLFEEQLSKVGRVVLFVDVCKSGVIGSIKNANINTEVQHLGEVQGDLFGLMASRPRELSLESPEFGGGHGLFSYFVLKGLSGDADTNKDGKVDASELIKYVDDQVAAGSNNKQHPREFGVYDNSMKLSDTTVPGIDLAGWPILYDSRSGEPLYLASADEPALTPQATHAVDDFEAALKAGRLYPDQPDGAFSGLDRLRPLLTSEQYDQRANQLRVKLEDQAQNVLLTYLTGDQVPQLRGDFETGDRAVQAALRLTPESLFLGARDDFFRGRVLLFDKKYADAQNYLESAVRTDPGAGYAYNALGIAYLEQAMYGQAVDAFRDASNRAQHWAYPLHNLALAYYQKGEYRAAIDAYQRAIRLAPQFAYLHYNLGLIYQRLNRSKDAEAMYRKALALRPDAQTYNVLGYLKFSQNKPGEAEGFYKAALAKDPSLLIARHDYAVLLDSIPKRREEGLRLWREILQQDPQYTLSRLALAKSLEREGRNAEAAAEFRILVNQKPEYSAARLALGDLEEKLGNRAGALEQFTEAARLEPESASIYERVGDLKSAEGDRAAAVEAYEKALSYAVDSATKKSIRKKLPR
jgi:tetratricopeptide (TPR) repeat protein